MAEPDIQELRTELDSLLPDLQKSGAVEAQLLAHLADHAALDHRFEEGLALVVQQHRTMAAELVALRRSVERGRSTLIWVSIVFLVILGLLQGRS
jgi:hypothetical protein